MGDFILTLVEYMTLFAIVPHTVQKMETSGVEK